LPGSLYISAGTANAFGETAIGFTMPGDGDVSEEWGYDTSGLKSGSLLNDGIYEYDDAVSAMESQTTDQFEAGSLAPSGNLNGPDFGLLSGNYATTTLGNGVEGIQDSITIKLDISGTWNKPYWDEQDLINAIDGGAVALTFGSPTVADGNVPVPEPGTFVLLGAVLGAGWFIRRRRSA
ncbi:MAG: PEP-CTERM sorting domain-containing protein, partial [Planctomycetota bacterium]